MNNKSYILYTNRNSEIDSITEFIDQQGLSIVRSLSKDEVLNYTDENGVKNIDRIYNFLSQEDQELNEQSYFLGTLDLFPFGCTILLPKENLFRETLAVTGVNQVSEYSRFNAFFANQLVELLKDARYEAKTTFSRQNFNLSIRNPEISIIFWSRALNQFIDASNHIISCSINVDENGGNFSIELAPVLSNLELYSNNTIDSNFLYHDILSSNDLVFIRYEKLILERNNREFLDKSKIPGQIYDMIGLIDNNTLNKDYQTSNVVIQISGKDLSKVLIEDGSYFYPLQFAQNVFINPDENRKLIQRLVTDGQFILQSAYAFRSILFTLQYLINHVSTMGVVPDDLFSAYGDRRTLVYRLDEARDLNYNSEQEKQLQLSRKDLLEELREAFAVNNDINNFQGNLLNEVIDFFQIAFVIGNLSSTGYSSFGYLGENIQENTSPSFLLTQNIGLFRTINVDFNENNEAIPTRLFNKAYNFTKLNNSISQQNEEIVETLQNGVWQIIKLVVDENVSNRRVADSSISNPDGALINQFKKVCQDPFVEFFTDTYGDLFYFIVRQPPFNEKAILSVLNEDLNRENLGQFRDLEEQRSIIIDLEDVLSTTLQFDEDNIFSFYEIKPEGLFLGNGNSVSLAYVPIIYFPQYADIWGTRRLSVVSNYIPYNGLISDKSSENNAFFIEQVSEDLKFLVDCHCYIPFTRKGTIVLEGDRRIKRGTFVRFNEEIFYVDAINQSYSISNNVQRTTTLTVSRGMIEKYIKGVQVNFDGSIQRVSYFNIINTELIKQFIVNSVLGNDTQNSKVEIQRNFAVNQNIFNFFLQKRQLIE